VTAVGEIGPPIERVRSSAYTIPTDAPESDGTLEWSSTTIVVVEVAAGGKTGTGYSYGDAAAGDLIRRVIAELLLGRGAMEIPALWRRMLEALRNIGRPGIGSTALAAVDVALWDLKARLLELPLVSLLGSGREQVPVYGSGGFTSYDNERLAQQLAGWVETGISSVKMKVGREPDRDADRVRVARQAIGDKAALLVDANGAYDQKLALKLSEEFASQGVTWFEEPVSSDDLEGLAEIRAGVPSAMEVTAGEYGYDVVYFQRMLAACSVDVLQPDATRCGGVTGFLQVAPLSEAHHVPLSTHTAPSLHVHLACAVPAVRHIEYFHDHVRIEQMLFDGVTRPVNGDLAPDRLRSGLGLELKRDDAAGYRVFDSTVEAA